MRSNFGLTTLATVVFSLTCSSAFAGQAQNEEARDRVVDQAAVDMQSDADRDLSLLVTRYRGTAKEAEMLLRLSELRMEIADGLFRVAYGPSEGGLKKSHQAKLASALAPLSRIISKYPKSAGYPRALFLRGKAQKELGELAPAAKDFEKFLARFSSRPEAGMAMIAVADISIEKKNFKRAVSVLAPMTKKTTHALYPHALAKRAWAFHVDERAMPATKTLKVLATHLSSKQAAGTLSAGDQGLREAVLSDVPAIGYSAYRTTKGRFSLFDVNALLRMFDTGEGYRRMAVNMADRLRAADRDTDLRIWKGIVLKSEPASKENLPMLLTILEYDLGREAYGEVVKTAVDVSKIVGQAMEAEEAEPARKMVVKTADILTKRITDYRSSPKANQAEQYLTTLLPAFDRMTAKNDPRRAALRWNLAETYFSLERFELAARAYRAIVETGNSPLVKDAALKAISSRYEGFRTSKVMPEALVAQAKVVATTKVSAKQLAELREWMIWIDRYEREYKVSLDQFQFEAARALYAARHQDEAMGRLKNLAKRDPSSKVAVASAALVVDTWLARHRYDQVEANARDFAEMKKWAQGDFASKMMVQAAAAKFKRAELAYAAKKYVEAGKQASEFRKTYGKSNLALDATGILCNSAMARGERGDAAACFLELAEDFPKTEAARQALRSAARIEDERLRFKPAMANYSKYLNTSGSKVSAKESLAIRRRLLQLARATGETDVMLELANSKQVCRPKLEGECDMNVALAALVASENSPSRKTLDAAYSNMKRARPALRSIWAMVVAGNAGSYDAGRVNDALRIVAKNWSSTEPSARYHLIARATKSLSSILERDRLALKKQGLQVSEASIAGRMKGLGNLEARAKLLGAVPVNSVQASAAMSVYTGYNDLIADFRDLPTEKEATAAQKAEHNRLIAGLVNPLVFKARKIRDAGVALARKDERGLQPKNCAALFRPAVLATNANKASVVRLASEWRDAINDENWARVAFFSEEAVEMEGVSGAWSKAARAASLSNAGAAAEAGVVLSDACRESSATRGLRDACRKAKGRG